MRWTYWLKAVLTLLGGAGLAWLAYGWVETEGGPAGFFAIVVVYLYSLYRVHRWWWDKYIAPGLYDEDEDEDEEGDCDFRRVSCPKCGKWHTLCPPTEEGKPPYYVCPSGVYDLHRDDVVEGD